MTTPEHYESDVLFFFDGKPTELALYQALERWAKFGGRIQGHSLPCGHFIPEEAPLPMLEAVERFL